MMPSIAGPLRTIFVSHAHADNALCDQYVSALRARGYDVWYDLSNMEGGQSLSAQIEHELLQRSAFIVFLTPASLASSWVRLEIDAYRDLVNKDPSRRLLPVLAGPCDVPPLLRGIKWIDAMSMPLPASVDAIDHALRQTPEQIQQHKGRRNFPGLRWGGLLGIAAGISNLGALVLFDATPAGRPGQAVVYFFLVLDAVIGFLAGYLATRQSGLLRSGVLASVLSQFVGLLIVVAAAPIMSTFTITGGILTVLLEIGFGIAFGIIPAVVVGLAGGLFGRRAYRRYVHAE